MLEFFFRRSFRALTLRRRWFLLAFLPVLLYLGITAARPGRYRVEQKITIAGDAMILLSPRASDIRSLHELMSTPKSFFLNRFAVAVLTKRLNMGRPYQENLRPGMPLLSEIENCMRFDMKGMNGIGIVYEGDNREEGKAMVAFYAHRLMEQAKDYLALDLSAVRDGTIVPGLKGKITIVEKRMLWCNARLLPALSIFLATLVFLTALIALLEWFKPSFRSERQVAGYLEVPILGAFPDLKRIARMEE